VNLANHGDADLLARDLRRLRPPGRCDGARAPAGPGVRGGGARLQRSGCFVARQSLVTLGCERTSVAFECPRGGLEHRSREVDRHPWGARCGLPPLQVSNEDPWRRTSLCETSGKG
jgi:hypothetical protein